LSYLNNLLLARLVITLLVGVMLAGCNSNTDLVDIVEDGEAGVLSLKTASDEIQLAVGQSFTLTTTAVFDTGMESVFSDEVRWRTADKDIATVNSEGTITAISPGEVAVSYSWRRITNTVNVEVTDAELVSIDFSDTQVEGNECSQSTLAASGLHSDGTIHPLSANSEWTSTDETIVVVESEDANTASLRLLNSGTAEITISSGLITASIPVTVADSLTELVFNDDALTIEIGGEQSLAVTGLYTDGTTAAIDTLAAYSLSGQTDTVTTPIDVATDPQNLLLDTHPDGTSDSSADTDDELDQSSEEEVVEEELEEVVEIIVASSDQVEIVQQQDSSLVIRAKQTGSTTLSAECGGQLVELPLTIVDPPLLETLSFTGIDAEIEPGDTLSPQLTANFSDGSEESIFDNVEWSILSGDVESFELDTATGQISANPDIVFEQSVILLATYQSLTTEIEIFSQREVNETAINTQLYVVDSTGESVPLTTDVNPLSVGDTLQLQLKTTYNTGREELSVTDLFWSNVNPTIASIDGGGLLTALSTGVSTILAIRDDEVRSFQFTVSGIPDPTTRTGWSDSYSVNGQCYCDTDFDHGLSATLVTTPAGQKSVPQICADIQSRLGSGSASGRLYFNTVQCGHDPKNSATDETACPGIPRGPGDFTGDRCNETGATWNINSLYVEVPE